MSDVITRGRMLLAQRAAPVEQETYAEDATEIGEGDDGPSETDLLNTMCTLMQLMIDRIDALERAMSAPRVRTPTRDETGKIVSVTDTPIPTMAPQLWASSDMTMGSASEC